MKAVFIFLLDLYINCIVKYNKYLYNTNDYFISFITFRYNIRYVIFYIRYGIEKIIKKSLTFGVIDMSLL